MKSLFRGAFFRGASASVLALGLAACTDNPQALNRPGDVPPAFTAPIDKAAPIWPKAGWWANFGAEELTPLEADGAEGKSGHRPGRGPGAGSRSQ